jgi:hypothetical protein
MGPFSVDETSHSAHNPSMSEIDVFFIN